MSVPLAVPTTEQFTAARSSLTRREWDVAELLADGLQAKAIAATLGVSVHTVRRHSEAIFRKLKVQSRTVAALRIRDMMASTTDVRDRRPNRDGTLWFGLGSMLPVWREPRAE